MTSGRSHLTKNRFRKGSSIVEYSVLIIIILSALYMMKDSIGRGIFSKYKQTGESFGFGRQYDAKRTVVCKTDDLTDGYIVATDSNETSIYQKSTSNLAILTNQSPAITYDEDCYQTKVRRATGGCPQCSPGDTSCFLCEDRIKLSCQNAYCNK